MRPDHNPIDFETIEREQEQQARYAAVDEKDKLDGWFRLMKDRLGRDMVWRQLDEAGLAPGKFRSPFNTNAMQMARNTGIQSQGEDLSSYLQINCPELWIQMVKEHQEKDDGNRDTAERPTQSR